jgi:DNA-binding NarL/FixJ family response regulator
MKSHEPGESGYGLCMQRATPAHRPVRITLDHECELVTRGLTEMLAPYAARVVLVPGEPGGEGAADVDLTLHDFAAGLHSVPGPGLLPSVRHAGRLVAYTWHPRPDLVDQALDCGVAGVLAKSLPAAALVAALEAIHRGEVVVEYGARLPQRDPAPEGEQLLTPREEEIVRLITQGLDNFSIAREVSLSINSIKSHIRSAYRKMGVGSRSQAVLWGVRHGFLDEASGPVPVADEPALTG